MWAILALASAVFESIGLVVEKKTLIKEHAMEFSAAMSLFALLFTTPIWYFSDAKSVPLDALGWIFLASLTSSLTILFFAKALRHMAISFTAPFLAFGPLVTAILAFVFLDERLNLMQWSGVVILMFGAYLLYSHSHQSIFEPIKHFFKIPHMKFVWIGILFYSITGVLDKKIVGDAELNVPVLSYLVLLFFFICVIFIVMMLTFHDGFKGIGKGMRNNSKWLSIVALSTILFKGLIIYAISLPGVLLSLVIPIKKLSSLFTTLIGGELFHEHNILRKAIACTIMILGACLILI